MNKLELELLNFVDRLVEEDISSLSGVYINVLYKWITYFHFVKALTSVKSIGLLYRNNLFPEALLLSRALTNIHINIAWILNRNVDERAQRYADMERVMKQKNLESTFEFKELPTIYINSKKYKENKLKAENILKKYNYKSYSSVRNWSGLHIKDMAIEVGFKWEYSVLYSHLSEYEHCGPSSVSGYTVKNSVLFRPNKNKGLPLLFSTIEQFLAIKLLLLKTLKCKLLQYSFDILEYDKLKSNNKDQITYLISEDRILGDIE